MRECGWCGKSFEPSNEEQKYCNPNHTRKARQVRHKAKVLAGEIAELTEEEKARLEARLANLEKQRVICATKAIYGSPKAALAAISAKRLAGMDVRSWYQCPVCGWLHLTSKPWPAVDEPLVLRR
jgi:rubrerythrin